MATELENSWSATCDRIGIPSTPRFMGKANGFLFASLMARFPVMAGSTSWRMVSSIGCRKSTVDLVVLTR